LSRFLWPGLASQVAALPPRQGIQFAGIAALAHCQSNPAV
jgi:hypothetical protein